MELSSRQLKISWLAPFLACRAKGCTCVGWRPQQGESEALEECTECEHLAHEHGNLGRASEKQLDDILGAVQMRISSGGGTLSLSESAPFESPSIRQLFQRYGEWVWAEDTGNEEFRVVAVSHEEYKAGCKMCFRALDQPSFLADLPELVTADPKFAPYHQRWRDHCGPDKEGRLSEAFGRTMLLHVAPLLRSALVRLQSAGDRTLACGVLAAVAREVMDPRSLLLESAFDASQPRPGHEQRKRGAGEMMFDLQPLAPLEAPAPPPRDFVIPKGVEGISFRVYQNDGSAEALVNLAAMKQIFSLQLPKMPREYITRLVFDTRHQTLVAAVNGTPIGGICFRPFYPQGFVEVTFCAITTDRQVRGYGSLVMNQLKTHCQRENLYYMLTYADSFATGYFKKQGYSDIITLNSSRWKGFIKDYSGATLMECHISPKVDYLTFGDMLKEQRDTLEDHMEEVTGNGARVYNGLSAFKSKRSKTTSVDPAKIPGVMDAGWDPEEAARRRAGVEEEKVERKMLELLTRIKQHSYAWPFKDPVDPDEVPDYYEVIKDPVDLQMVDKRLQSKYYVTVPIFLADLKRMVDNCKSYNDPHTSYYKCAVAIEAFIESEIKRLGLE